jgi:hypothetical protein
MGRKMCKPKGIAIGKGKTNNDGKECVKKHLYKHNILKKGDWNHE